VNLINVTINDGNNGNNYSLTLGANNQSSITPAPLSVNGLQLADKTYDGTTLANVLTPGSLGGVLTGVNNQMDNVTLSSQLIDGFPTKNVNYDGTGNIIPVNMSAVHLSAASDLQGLDAGNYYISQVILANAPTISQATLKLLPQSETVDYGVALSKPVLLSLNGGVFQPGTSLLSNDTISNLSAEFRNFSSIKKLGKDCCTIIVSSGYSVNDGNGGRNYSVSQSDVVGSINATLPGASTGDSTNSASADAVKNAFPWSNGRTVSGENKTGAITTTADTLKWDVTDPQTQKRVQLTCGMFQGASQEVCGREIAGRSLLAPTRSYQLPEIEFK